MLPPEPVRWCYLIFFPWSVLFSYSFLFFFVDLGLFRSISRFFSLVTRPPPPPLRSFLLHDCCIFPFFGFVLFFSCFFSRVSSANCLVRCLVYNIPLSFANSVGVVWHVRITLLYHFAAFAACKSVELVATCCLLDESSARTQGVLGIDGK